MGYTHYWKQDNDPASDEQWTEITLAFRQLLAHAPVRVQREDEVAGSPEIDGEVIIFNGVEQDGHETMALERDAPGFHFCKTARKDYDLIVTALLILANHYAPGVWKITSDGSPAEWQPALTWMNSVGPVQYKLPKL